MDKAKALDEIKILVENYERVVNENRVKTYNEESTKKDFILPLFEALGWKVKDSREVSAEETISKKRVDYGFRINGIPKFFLEAKSLKEDLDAPKFVEQAINYSWLKACTWAILTNFETIRIFNAEWKTARLFDKHFRTIHCSEFVKRFDELWFLSRDSFVSNALDDEAEKLAKRTKRMRVDKQLWTDLSRFREMLSKSVTKLNQTKQLSHEDLDEAIQRVLDRLIFIRCCEDRELEPRILISNLRDWESKGRGQLIKSLREVFSSFKTIYNSEIFAPSECDELEIDNDSLHEIIQGLYYTKDEMGQYDFSAIDADILGNIYEQYLGHILRKTEKRATVKQNYRHRKQEGIYYTPTYIVDYIVESTVGELLKRKKVDVRKIRVLDPACGSGSFLIKAFDYLYSNYAKSDEGKQALLDFKTGIIFQMEVQILLNNIFGVDLDKQAVEIARLNILLRLAESGQRLPLLKQNIKLGNSLSSDQTVAGDRAFNWNEQFKDIMSQGGFDVVMGNPPYLDSEEMVRSQPELRKAYARTFETAKGNWDIFCIFLEKGISLLKDGGYLGMIVPNKLLSADYATAIRNYIKKYRVVSIRDYSNVPVFQASVYPVVIVIQKVPPKNNKLIAEVMEPYAGGVQIENRRDVNQKDLASVENTWSHIFGEAGEKVRDKVLANSERLGNIADVSGAASVSEAYAIKPLITELRGQRSYFKFINTGTVDRYSCLWSIFKTAYIKTRYNQPIITKNDLYKFSKSRYEQAQATKIVIGGMNKRIEAYLDDGNCFAGKSTGIVLNAKINPKILLALLNSKLMTFYYKNVFKTLSLAGGFMRIGSPQIKKLPIRNVPSDVEPRLIQLVDRIIALNQRLNMIYFKKTEEHYFVEEEIRKTDAKIDELVYLIYGITEPEKKIIEKNVQV
ncbi:MAG: N-6 DNA methylase [Candidatus Bathyarchaeota archaeon]|nr:N-6 DNA methylase [Candidatus Bathyarchaeota archaeon]